MPGNIEGGRKAAETNKRKYGPNFYKNIGSKGGIVKTRKGFALDHERAVSAGRKGGAISRRTKKEK